MNRFKIYSDGFYHGIVFFLLVQLLAYNIQGIDHVISRMQQNVINHPWWYQIGWPTVIMTATLITWIVVIVCQIITHRRYDNPKGTL